MKPSERIYGIIGKTSSDPDWNEIAIMAIIKHLDEEYENNLPPNPKGEK